MSCVRFAADLSAWIDRELSAPRAAAVAEHVAGCADCGAQVDALRRADGELRAIPLRELKPGAYAELRQRTLRGARAEARKAPAWRVRWLGGAAGASAAAAAAGVALYLGVRRPDSIDSASPEDLAVAIDLDTALDLEVIANLEVLEKLVALDEGQG
jgi:anti-sigma factor RsiW